MTPICLSPLPPLPTSVGTALLSFRVGESKEYYPTEPKGLSGAIYAVGLIALPPLPGRLSGLSHLLTVVAATRFPDLHNDFGWVHLEVTTKHEIGDDLRGIESYAVGKWFFLRLFTPVPTLI